MKITRALILVVFFITFGILKAETPPGFEIMTGKAAEESIRNLFPSAIDQNVFEFHGKTEKGARCTLSLNTPESSDSFIVTITQADSEVSTTETIVAQITISKMATVAHASRAFDTYKSEFYKLFIPSNGWDTIEYKFRPDGSDWNLMISTSLDQNKWFLCGPLTSSASSMVVGHSF